MSPDAGSRPLPPSRATAAVFAALGDPTRLQLVAKLSDGSRQSIAQLSRGQPLSRQAISKHLRVLQQVQVVHSLRAGRERRFVLNPEPMREALQHIEQVSGLWDASLSRLKSLVESTTP